jgi:adenine-specific DNA methylase
MNYIGSKLSLLEFLENSIEKVVDKNSRVFCDLFAGTGAVGTYFKRKGYKVIANDIQYYSFVLNKQYIENHQHLKFIKLIKILPELNNIEIPERKVFVCDYLSNLKGEKGFVYKNYCLGGTRNQEFERQYFSDENGMRCDAIRMKIEEWLSNVFYDEFGTHIWNKEDESGSIQLVADVRGWGRIQNEFTNYDEAAKFQDEVGEFITEAIKEKIERLKNKQ